VLTLSSLAARVSAVEVLLLDVDGVLTDGSVVYSDAGHELKRFHVRDGSGLKIWHDLGKRTAILSGRRSPTVERRAAELGIALVMQGRANKRTAVEEILIQLNVRPDQVCAIGDDLPDFPVLKSCGVGIAVADACDELKAIADYVTTTRGGHGAVREAIEWLMKTSGQWDTITRSLLS
jgi:3-deoxy-D-manno-octulosonate 8-phosphate phosphatase (KDO 8-P phosphatase)